MAAKLNKRFQCPRHWTLAQRLDHYTDKSGGPNACWPWTGDRNKDGYGRLTWKGKKWLAHRLTWVEKNGPVPPGLCVLHDCDNPPCRNEDHLWVGNRDANAADRDAKGRGIVPIGEHNGSAKLTEADVRDIRADTDSHRAIAKRFGIGKTTVGYIRSGKKWRHVL